MTSLTRTLTAIATLSLLAATAGCMTPPAELDLSLGKHSQAGHYEVTLLPPATAPAVGQLHSWKIHLAAADGTPIKGAQFTVGGGMPQHGHGYPTQPRVTRELEDGTYLLEGMKFSMTGWWDLKLGILAAPGADQVTFNIVIEPKAQG